MKEKEKPKDSKKDPKDKKDVVRRGSKKPKDYND